MQSSPQYLLRRESHVFFFSAFLLILLGSGAACLRAAVVDDCSQETLVLAIEEGGYVSFELSCSLTLTNPITIRNTVILDGVGFTNTISGGNARRLFIIENGGDLNLWNLKLTSGRAASGGAIYVKPGGQLTLSNCLLQANSAVGANGSAGNAGEDSTGIGGDGGNGSPGLPGLGGAIYNGGVVRAYACQFTTNSATGGHGGNGGNGGDGSFEGGNGGDGAAGAVAMGGAIYNGNKLFLQNCSFESNSLSGGKGGAGGAGGDGPYDGFPGTGGSAGAVFGAGIYSSAYATVVGCTFSSNNATAGNGAVGGTLSNGSGSAGTSGGEARGGALCLSGSGAITNSTFYKNRLGAGNGGNGGPGDFYGGDGGNGGNASGGAILNLLGTTYVVNCTIAENTAIAGTNGVAGSGPFKGEDGTGGVALGGGIASNPGSVYLENTVLSGNSPGGNLSGVILDRGYNISSDASVLLPAASSRAATNPRLGAFGNNGGPTKTIALLTNSPAIDKIPPARSPALDQRGVPRPVNTLSDIGSVERGYAVSGRVTVGTNGLAGVLISSEGGSATTLAGGGYTLFAGEANITLLPTLAGYQFSPASRTLAVSANMSNINFTASPLYSLGGQVADGTNGLSGVQLTARASAVTNTVLSTNGVFLFSGLSSNVYTVTPVLSGYRFEPTTRSILVKGNTNGVNFSGIPTVGLQVQTNGVAQIQFTGVSNLSYRVDASSNLTLWLPIATKTAPFQIIDSDATNTPIRFYRVSPF